MTTVVSVAQGGTGSNNAAAARSSLGAAPSAAYDQANNAYSAANTAASTGGGGYAQANAAYDQANAAYLQANNAYAAANTVNLLSGGVITGTLNVTQDIIVGGNVYLEGNTTYINVATYSIEDSLMYLASNNSLTDSVDIGFMGGKNTSGTYSHTGFARDATDGKWKLFDGLAEEGHVGNVVDFANTNLATLVANVEANTLSVVNGVSGNVNFDSSTLFVDSVNDRIGIGTSNPGYKLDVNGTISASGELITLGNDARISLYRSSGTNYFDWSSGQSLYLSTQTSSGGAGRSTKMVLLDGGNVGIGTTSPGKKLDVYGELAVRQGNAGAPSAFDVTYPGSPVSARLAFGTDNTGWQMRFAKNVSGTYTDYMTITDGGLVGIGTTSPTSGAKFAVRGSTDLGDSHSSSTSATHTTRISGYALRYDASTRYSSYGLLIFNADTGWTSSARRYMITNGLDTSKFAIIRSVDATTDPALGDAGAISSGTADFVINNSGNIGIGTTSPSYLLHVNGTSYFNGNVQGTAFHASGRDAPYTSISETSSGAMSIFGHNARANSSFANRVSAQNTGYHGHFIRMYYSDGITFTTSTGTKTVGDVLYDANSALIVSGTAERMRIDTGGNVGIGTTSPNIKLHVVSGTGAAYTNQVNKSNNMFGISVTSTTNENTMQGIWFASGSGAGTHWSGIAGSRQQYSTDWSTKLVFFTHNENSSDLDGATEKMVITGGGNVGIGTTNPSQKLHVVGNILANGCPVQVQYTSSGTRTTVDSTSFVEPSTSYRVAITPKSTSSMIRLRFFIPTNAYGASNTIYTVRLFRIIGGSTSYSLTSAGGSNGSRNVIAGSTFRPPGYDNNDPMPIIIDAVDFPSTTSTCTYGFEFKRETGGSGTVYFGYTQGDNSNWGFDSDIVIIAEEIGQ